MRDSRSASRPRAVARRLYSNGVGIVFRPAAAQDAEALVALCAELGYPTSAEDLRSRIAALGEDDAVVLAEAEEDGGVVGWVHVMRAVSLVSGAQAVIAGLVVQEALRGRGVGRRLVGAAEGWARSRGLSQLALRCRVERDGAHAFYRRVGFEERKRQVLFARELR